MTRIVLYVLAGLVALYLLIAGAVAWATKTVFWDMVTGGPAAWSQAAQDRAQREFERGLRRQFSDDRIDSALKAIG